MIILVNRFNEQRLKAGLTIAQLSEKTNISAEELIEIETDGYSVEEMSAIKAAHIAKALGCLISDLIYKDVY